ncbi:MAG: AraC family transcriptional regulator ligand-binding domain-containing protein [Geminicoccaceae bacterium]
MAALDIESGTTSPLATSDDVLVRRCMRELDREGLSCEPIARALKFRLPAADVPGGRVSVRNEQALLRDAECLAHNPFLGWALGAFELRDLGLYGYAVRNAADLRAALDIVIQLSVLLSESAHVVLHVDGGEATLAQACSNGGCCDQVTLRLMLNHLGELVGPGFEPIRVGLPVRDEDELNGLRERSGLAIEPMDQPLTFVTFASRLLDQPVHDADAMLARTLRRLWEEERERLAQRTHELNKLQWAILPLLPFGEPRMDEVAEAMDMSTAALRKRLASLDTSLTQLVAALRTGLVGGLLAEPGMTLPRAAQALGYADVSTLTYHHGRSPPMQVAMRKEAYARYARA